MFKLALFGVMVTILYGFIHKKKKPDTKYKSWFGNAFGDFGKKKDKEGGERGIQQAGEQLYGRGALQYGEEKQYPASFKLGELIEQLQKYQLGLAEKPAGYLTPEQQYLRETGDLGGLLYKQTLAEAQDPYAYYESQLQPQLQLAEDYINRSAQNRGLIRSGIPIEQMGRAGVELAIKEAEARQNARSQALARTAGLTEYIGGQQQNRFAGLQNLYGQQQQFGLSAMGRQAQQAQAAAQYQAYPYQAQLGSYYGGRAALQALPGQIIGAAGQVGMGMAMGGGVGSKATKTPTPISYTT